jgi:hypothetical protein
MVHAVLWPLSYVADCLAEGQGKVAEEWLRVETERVVEQITQAPLWGELGRAVYP